ncbi:MAG: hypothetical protein IH885_09830 [Myxococcales bacterium]|nr:hypothetical protein [Myxococcales bacterium]
MEDSGYLVGVLAGISCFIAGTRLIRLSWRSQKSPELLLGSSLLLWGLAYVCWQIPIEMGNPLTQPLLFAARVFTDAATIVFATFTWIAFRSQARWAKTLVFAIAIGVFTGIAGSIAVGDWGGIQPISNPWWWADWAAGLVALSWVGVEGFIHYRNARPRVRLGLCDPLVCNRYLLWGITGIVWTAVWGALVFEYIEFETQQVWSSAMERVAGTLDITGVALVLIICFPPRFYQRWIAGASPAPEPEEA